MSFRKIYDIIPPQSKEPEEIGKEENESFILSNVPTETLSNFGKDSTFKLFNLIPVKIVILISVIFLLLLLSIGIIQTTFLRATITIWPAQEKWHFEKKIVVLPTVNNIDVNKLTLPGRLIKVEKELSSQFNATGEITKEGRAKGVIRVYNNYHLPQILVANTRFLSPEGKLFRSTHRVEIPPGGEQDVEVVAAEPGEEYNIKPTTFSIPGLAGTPRYTQVYGKSFSKMEGGGVTTVFQVTAEDIQKARESLITQATQEGKEKLLSELEKDNDLIFFEDSFSESLGEVELSAKEGDELPSFQGKVKVTTQAIVFSKKTLNNFLAEVLAKERDNDKVFNENTLDIKFNLISVDWQKQELNLLISGSANIYSKLNLETLKHQLLGRSINEVRHFLDSLGNIDHFQIKLTPIPWISIPSDLDRIMINLRL